MSKRRVLQVIPRFCLGGAERIVVNLVKYLDSNHFETAALSLFDRCGTELEDVLDKMDAPVWYLGKRLGFDPRMFWRFDRIVRLFRPHVVHTHLSPLRYVLPSLVLRRVPAVVHTFHNPADKETDRVGRLVRRVAFKVGVVPVAISDEVKKGILSTYRIATCPLILNGISVDDYAHGRQNREALRKKEGIAFDDFVYICVGRLVPQKDHYLLLRAFAEGPARNPRAKLIIAGDGKLRRSLEAHCESAGLQKKVRFLGNRNDISDLLGTADVFVLSSRHEGNPLCVMEAMAAGLPIVATAVGSLPESIDQGRTGILVQPKDAVALADSMLKLMEDNALMRDMGFAAAERAKKFFGIRVMTQAYERLYRKLLVN